MPRRARVIKREVPPDPRYGSRTLTRFMNKMMLNGKKSLAERIVYTAMDTIERTARRAPLDVFDTALRNATPLLEVKPRRVGGATYQVPVEIKGDRKQSLAAKAAQVTLIATFALLCYVLITFGRSGLYALPILYAALLVFFDARPDVAHRIFPKLWQEK